MKSPLVAIVDDDEALCSSMVDLMRSTDYSAESFASAEALLASSNLALFDCLIADVHMHGMSGLDLVRKLREQGNAAPVILITASSERRLDDAAAAVGAQYLLRKPLETNVLLECIERSCSDER